MKILHVIPSISPLRGGPSQAVIDMVMSLRQAGVDAAILTTNDNGSGVLDVAVNQWTEYRGVPVYFLPRWSPPISILREYAYSPALTKWLDAHLDDYDVLHVHAIFSYLSTKTMAVCRRRGKPYILRTIGQLDTWSLSQSAWRKKLMWYWLEKRNARGASVVHTTSEMEKQNVKALLGNNRIECLPLGVRLPQIPENHEHKHSNTVCRLLYLSRLHPKKNIELLIDALAQLKHVEWHLDIAGDGESSYVASVQNKIMELGMQEHIQFHGHVDEKKKQDLFHHAQVFVLTSRAENFGISVIEAMSHGLPVVITHGVALAETVQQNQLGLVCDNTTDSVTTAISTMIEDASEQQRLGDNARRYVEVNYNWQTITKTIIGLYSEIIHSEKAGRAD